MHVQVVPAAFMKEKLYLFVKADHNDADYIYGLNEIDKRTLDRLKPLFEKIKAKGSRHNFPNQDWEDKKLSDMYPSMDKLLEIFLDSYCPRGDNGVHTIESIKVLTVVNEEKLV